MSTLDFTREQLAQYILNTAKESSISKIKSIILSEKNEEEKDFYDELPNEIQELLMESKEDIKNGKFFTHDEVMSEARKRFNIAG